MKHLLTTSLLCKFVLLCVFIFLSQCGSFALAQPKLSPAVDEPTKKWGFVTNEGKFVVPANFELCGQFISDLAPVMTESGWGYISPDGKFQIEPIFQFADNFSEEVAAVINKEGRLQYIDIKGNVVLNTKWSWGERFSEGQAVVKTSDLGFAVIDLKGNRRTDIEYRFIGECHSGLAPAQRNDNAWTYLKNGQELLVRFQYASRFSSGVAWVLVEDRYGLIDRDMNFVISPKYDFAVHVKDTLALTRTASNVQIVNFTVKSLPSISAPDLVTIAEEGGIGFASSGRGFVCGAIDKDGRPFISETKTHNLVEVGLSSNKDSIRVYRPTKWDYVRAIRSGGIEKLLTIDYQCPSNTDCSCSLNRFTEYRIIFLWEGKTDIRSCIPSRDTKVRGTF